MATVQMGQHLPKAGIICLLKAKETQEQQGLRGIRGMP